MANWILVENDTPDYPIPVWITRKGRGSADIGIFDTATNQWYVMGESVHHPWVATDDVIAWATNMPPLPYGYRL